MVGRALGNLRSDECFTLKVFARWILPANLETTNTTLSCLYVYALESVKNLIQPVSRSRSSRFLRAIIDSAVPNSPADLVLRILGAISTSVI